LYFSPTDGAGVLFGFFIESIDELSILSECENQYDLMHHLVAIFCIFNLKLIVFGVFEKEIMKQSFHI